MYDRNLAVRSRNSDLQSFFVENAFSECQCLWLKHAYWKSIKMGSKLFISSDECFTSRRTDDTRCTVQFYFCYPGDSRDPVDLATTVYA